MVVSLSLASHLTWIFSNCPLLQTLLVHTILSDSFGLLSVYFLCADVVKEVTEGHQLKVLPAKDDILFAEILLPMPDNDSWVDTESIFAS